jgi:hypothetical protein
MALVSWEPFVGFVEQSANFWVVFFWDHCVEMVEGELII